MKFYCSLQIDNLSFTSTSNCMSPVPNRIRLTKVENIHHKVKNIICKHALAGDSAAGHGK
jgi:hypothetical protein